MKNIILSILLVSSLQLSAQCKDIYGSPAECPTSDDSLVLYNNAIRVTQFYDSNRLYRLQNSEKLIGASAVREVFEDLVTARRMFNIIRRELRTFKQDKFTAGKPSDKYHDISYSQYYQDIDESRFYQRELENQIVNRNAPMSMYDVRIAPIMVNTYICEDTASEFFNDLVNIPLYVPVVVKPYNLLTALEMETRHKILGLPMPIKYQRHMVKRDSLLPKRLIVVQDTVQMPVNNFYVYDVPKLPVYLYNNYGSACIIGFLEGRKFRPLTYEEYPQYAMQNFARRLLEDPVALDKALRIKFGAYYEGLIK